MGALSVEACCRSCHAHTQGFAQVDWAVNEDQVPRSEISMIESAYGRTLVACLYFLVEQTRSELLEFQNFLYFQELVLGSEVKRLDLLGLWGLKYQYQGLAQLPQQH